MGGFKKIAAILTVVFALGALGASMASASRNTTARDFLQMRRESRMGSLSKASAIVAVVFVFGVFGASAASASVFTSTGGPIEGRSTTTQVFTFSGLSVECNVTSSTGLANAPTMSVIDLKALFSQCRAATLLGKLNVEMSPMEVGLTANQTIDVLNTATIKIPVAGCSLAIPPQGPLSSVALSSWPVAVSSLGGITYTSSGGLCGASGTTATFTGTTEYSGPVTRDP